MFKTPNSRKRLKAGIAIVCCLAFLTSSLAFFTDRVSMNTEAQAGTMDLTFTDISSSKSGNNGIKSPNEFAIDRTWNTASLVSDGGILNPGDYFDLSYTIGNTGNKSMDVRQQLVITSTVPMSNTQGCTLTITGENYDTEAVTGSLSGNGLTLTYNLDDAILNGTGANAEKENGVTWTEQTYTVRLDFLLTSSNAFQGANLSIALNAQAKQHRNTTDSLWADWIDYKTEFEQTADRKNPSDPPVLPANYAELAEVTGTSITLHPISGCEYSIDGTKWQDSTRFTGLSADTEYTLHIRYRATSSMQASNSVTCTIRTITEVPILTMSAPPSTNSTTFTVNGTVSAVLGVESVMVNGVEADVEQNGNWSAEVTLTGTTITAVATDTADNETSETITYQAVTVDQSNRADIGYDAGAAEQALTIPATFYDEGKDTYYKVTAIGDDAFKDGNLTSLSLPDSLTSIGISSFENNYKLTSALIIPDSVTSIGNRAFYGCCQANGLTLGTGVQTVGSEAFYDAGLRTLTIPSSLTTIEANAFACNNNLTTLTIPRTVTRIKGSAFDNCNHLTEITFEHTNSDPLVIDAYAFYAGEWDVDYPLETTINATRSTVLNYDWTSDCRAPIITLAPGLYDTGTTTQVKDWDTLVSEGNIVLDGTTITDLGDDFYYQGELYDLVIPANITAVGDSAFYNNDLIHNVIFEDNSQLTSIGQSAFYTGNSTFRSIDFGENSKLQSIGANAFIFEDSLDLDIPDTVTYIGPFAFHNTGLTNVVIPEGVTVISEQAFGTCCELTSVTIPSSVTTIEGDAFSHCDSLTDITFEHTNSDPIEIAAGAFAVESYVDTTINSVNASVLWYDWAADNRAEDPVPGLYNNGELVTPWNELADDSWSLSITLNDTGTTILYCSSSLTGELIVPRGITHIDERAFENSELTSVVLPYGLSEIGNYAFANSHNLNSVVIRSVTQIGEGAFNNCDSMTMTSIVIPKSVTYIGDLVFEYTYISDIYYIGTEEQWNAINLSTTWNENPNGSITVHYNSAGE